MIQAEKQKKKKIQSQIPYILDTGKKILKNIAKQFQKLKNLFPTLFIAKMGRYKPRKREKFQSQIPFILDPGKKIPKKIAKKLKNLFPALFIAKTG